MNFETIIRSYQHDLFFLFPVMSWIIATLGFALFAAPLSWIAWRQPAWAEKYRIQQKRGQGDRILLPSIKYSIINSTLSFLMVFINWPLLRLTGIHGGPLPHWYVMLGQFIFFVYLDDFIYYFFHRAMHWGWLYRHIHAVHHRFNVPWAVAAHYMHPVEFLITLFIVLSGPILVGAHVVTIWCWVLFRQWEAAEGHCGYNFPWNPSRLFPLYEGSAYHDYHHAKFRGNYAGFTGYLDRLFGTRSADYQEYLQRGGEIKKQH